MKKKHNQYETGKTGIYDGKYVKSNMIAYLIKESHETDLSLIPTLTLRVTLKTCVYIL